MNSIEELLIAFQMATNPALEDETGGTSRGRLKLSVAESLVHEAATLLDVGSKSDGTTGTKSMVSQLSNSLLEKVQKMSDTLRGMISHATTAAESIQLKNFEELTKFVCPYSFSSFH